MDSFWEKYFSVYDILNKVYPYQDLLSDLIGDADIKVGERILDAGSGTGNLAIKLKQYSVNLVCVDNQVAAVNLHKVKDSTANVQIHNLTERLPFDDNYFDKIFCNNTFYTIEKQKRYQLVDEFYRVLKPGGALIISDPKVGFRPLKIYLRHIRDSVTKRGFAATVYDLFRMIIPTIQMFYYNAQIKKRDQTGRYNFIDNAEHERYFIKGMFELVAKKKTYAGEAILSKFIKTNYKWFKKNREILFVDINGKTKTGRITVKIPDSSFELSEMFRIRYEAYLRKKYIQPREDKLDTDYHDPLECVYFVAILEQKIIGSSRILFGRKLPIEKDYFEFSEPDALARIPQEAKTEIGRIVSFRPNYAIDLPPHLVLLILFYSMSVYGKGAGFIAGYGAIKETVKNKLEKFSFPIHPIENTKTIFDVSKTTDPLVSFFNNPNDPVCAVYYIRDELLSYFDELFGHIKPFNKEDIKFSVVTH